jgi:methionyl-tRNA formyltransferase
MTGSPPAPSGFSPTVWAIISGAWEAGVTMPHASRDIAGDSIDEEPVPIDPTTRSGMYDFV